VRLSYTQEPARRMYDMWARASMPEVGPPVAAKLRGRATAGRLHAPCVAVRLLRASSQLVRHVRPGPYVIEWEPWRTSGETLPVTLRGTSGEICL
jgi:hypothetical protein